VSLVRQARLSRTATAVAQAVALSLGRGYRRTLAATQTQAVAIRRTFFKLLVLNGSHRISQTVRLGRQVGRVLRATEPTSVRVVRRINLTRSVTQGQSISLAGIPVKLQVLATVQTRSLALGRALSLMRGLVQPQLSVLVQALSLLRTLTVAPVLERVQSVSLTRSVAQGSLVSLSARNVTPLYQVLVTASVSQVVTLSSAAGAGKPAREFAVLVRGGDFIVSARDTEPFSVTRRGVTFTVEER
jgi:hypothetical protein